MGGLLDDFITRALLGGIGVALIVGPLGCFVVWRRMAYFGNALSHTALLGVALGFLLQINLTVAIILVCVTMSVVVVFQERQRILPGDTLLGIMAHVSLAAGLLVISFMERLRVDLMGYLFGDILAIGRQDVVLIFALAVITLVTLAVIWRGLLSATVDPDLAAIEGVPVERHRMILMILLAMVIAVGMKIVGILLITALLILPAAAARPISRTPEAMAVIASIIGIGAVLGGIEMSLQWDLPAGPSIVAVTTVAFLFAMMVRSAQAIRLSLTRMRAPPTSGGHSIGTGPRHDP